MTASHLKPNQCSECGGVLAGVRTDEAIDMLYGMEQAELKDLPEHIDAVLRNTCSEQTEHDILTEAMTRWLGFEPVELVRAVAHVHVCGGYQP
jgi:hypothetical protein